MDSITSVRVFNTLTFFMEFSRGKIMGLGKW